MVGGVGFALPAMVVDIMTTGVPPNAAHVMELVENGISLLTIRPSPGTMLNMEFKTIYTEERPEGKYHAEDHGANTYGVFFLGKRCRKPKYIATTEGPGVEGVKRRIEWYSKFRLTFSRAGY